MKTVAFILFLPTLRIIRPRDNFKLHMAHRNRNSLWLNNMQMSLVIYRIIPISNHSLFAALLAAQLEFRQHRSTESERRDVIRDLANVLEDLHPRLDGVLTNKDDAALFNIANTSAIRHHNAKQQTTYDKSSSEIIHTFTKLSTNRRTDAQRRNRETVSIETFPVFRQPAAP